MEHLNKGNKSDKIKDYENDVRKNINNFKKPINKDLKPKVIRDRGDSGLIKDKSNTKNKVDANISTSIRHLAPTNKGGKRDANIQDNEKKGDSDINKTRYENKSKNTLKDEVDKDQSKTRDEEKKKDETQKSNTKIDKINRKPLIKTMNTDDAKTYKTIEFTEQKQQKTLQIKLPHFVNNETTKIPKLINKYHQSKIDKGNVEEKVNNKRNTKDKKFKHKRDFKSPLRSQDGGSPTTEISKWAPSSDTQPYYEAWINTTLAAMSNKRKKQYMEKQNLFKSLQKALELGSKSPELVYENFTDERFTGKIKINHR